MSSTIYGSGGGSTIYGGGGKGGYVPSGPLPSPGLLAELEHGAAAPLRFGHNALTDLGGIAAGIVPGTYLTGKALAQAAGGKPKNLEDLLKGMGKAEIDYWGHDVLKHLYEHPTQALLDVLTVADPALGISAKAAKGLGSEGRLASLATRSEITTRSPQAILTGEGPVKTELTSAKPIAQARERLTAKL